MGPLKLSVIMPNYNHARYITESLDAIVNQSFTPFEVIVCDDGSTDNSVEIIKRFVDKFPFVRLIRNDSNLGIFPSLNKLMVSVSGDYLYCAAADDKILPGFFEKSMNLLQKYPQAGLCSTSCKLIDENGNSKKIHTGAPFVINDCFIDSSRARAALYKHGNWIGGAVTIYKRTALIENGGFNEKLYAYCDGFISQVVAVKYGACFVPEALVCWRVQDDGYAMTTMKNLDIRTEIIKNATDLMKGIFSTAHINKWKANELFSLKKDKMLFCRNRNLSDIDKNNFGRVLKTISKYGVNIVFVFQFLGILVYFLVRHGRYFNIVDKVCNKFQRFRVV